MRCQRGIRLKLTLLLKFNTRETGGILIINHAPPFSGYLRCSREVFMVLVGYRLLPLAELPGIHNGLVGERCVTLGIGRRTPSSGSASWSAPCVIFSRGQGLTVFVWLE